ncbi:MAG TPA: tRNA (N(6)-L-threonylcarbamoyladenosine(37)-C(2))-methylthiotransferase MtaB [Cyanobacteria bacterium UBA8530]|nr:tRNA (N(6)-L-threonylcarbamoyladenosine(37)-C(2))-methylthiotransferase MtaB [Cyanobacteria bacterium UBA8530]
MKSLSSITLGCKVNQAETEEFLSELAFSRVPPNAEADLVLVNTCAVTMEADRQSRQVVRRAIRRGCPVIVTGCAVSLDPESFRALGAIPVPDKKEVQAALRRFLAPAPASCNPLRTRGFLKVTEGCSNHCAYCIVPRARGEEKGVPLERLLSLVKSFEEAGIPEVVVTGTRLGTYGQEDFPLPRLLERLFEAAPGVRRWRLASIEPIDLSPAIAELFRHPLICPHLHLPLQSGSDKILQKMKRRYDLTAYEKSVQMLKESRKDLTLTTDLIVGFPGEEEEDFLATLKAVEDFSFAGVHAFPFSPRPGTEAAEWPRLPAPLVRERLGRLLEKAGKIRQDWLDCWLEQEVEVVVERVRHPLLRTGLSAHYLRVDFEAEEARQGEIVKVKVLSSEGEGAYGAPTSAR